MIYKVIGLMSGSSLDGLDIAYTFLEEKKGQWEYQIVCAECVYYTEKWTQELTHACNLQTFEFFKLHNAYGRWIGVTVNEFIVRHELSHKIDFIVSHGHTVFHEPKLFTTVQIGEGATIAAITQLPVISDLRIMDVAFGGQGAPIVPIGDRLLFGKYQYLLNIGGIANMTIQNKDQSIAFDVCPANQILNALANFEGLQMDEDGLMARQGGVLVDVLEGLNEDEYYKLPHPKSLSNVKAQEMIFPKLMASRHNTNDLLHTVCCHIAEQVHESVRKFKIETCAAKMLITGGGAFNKYLVEKIKIELLGENIEVCLPDDNVIKYKEALIMALFGTLRWRQEINVYSTVTGAKQNSIGGALWAI